jgi:hypothetical protein
LMLIGSRKYKKVKEKVHEQYTHYCVLLCNLTNKAIVFLPNSYWKCSMLSKEQVHILVIKILLKNIILYFIIDIKIKNKKIRCFLSCHQK